MVPIRHPARCSALCVLAAAALANLAVIAAPPCLPDAPARLAIADCVFKDMKYFVTLTCGDETESEQAFRIYREGASITTLGKNAKGFADEPPGSGPHTYGVEAYNAAGASERVTVSEEGCLY